MVWIIVALIVIAAGGYLGVSHYLVQRHLWGARGSLELREWQRARAQIDLFLRYRPESSEGLVLAARIARLAGDSPAADQYLERHRRLAGETPEWRLELALMHAEQGLLPGLPIKSANKLAVELSLRDPPQEMHKTRDYLSELLAAGHPESPAILESMIRGYLLNQRPLSALHCVEQLLRYRPDDIQVLLWHGELMFHYGEPQVSEAAYRKVLQLSPANDTARLRLGELLLRSHQPKEAEEHFEKLRNKSTSSPQLAFLLACCARDLGQSGKARQLLEQALAADPRHVDALIEFGRLHIRDTRPGEAESFLRRAVDAQPYNREANFVLAQCLEQRGRRDEARKFQATADRLTNDLRRVEEINKGLADKPDDAELRYEMGRLLERLGQSDQAPLWFESALYQQPGHRPSCLALAEHFDRIGRPEQARKYRQQAGTP